MLTVEDYKGFSIQDLKRINLWERYGTLNWTVNDEVRSSIGVNSSRDSLNLNYNVTEDGEKRSINENFYIDYTPCNFGGERPWIVCKCHKRVLSLYGGALFRCRHCYELGYNSQKIETAFSAFDRAEKLVKRIGRNTHVGFDNPFPPRPLGMHRKTYDQLRTKHDKLKEPFEALSNAMAGLPPECRGSFIMKPPKLSRRMRKLDFRNAG